MKTAMKEIRIGQKMRKVRKNIKGEKIMRKKERSKFKGFEIGLILLLGWLLVLPLAAEKRYEQKFEKTENLSRDGQVIISNVSGDIKVLVWKEERVKIEAIKRAEASSQSKAKENMDKVEIQVKAEPGLVRIETKYPESERFFGGDSSVSVDYTLWIPEKASVEAKSVSGDVRVEQPGGQVKANTVSGDVTVIGGKKSIAAKTVSGDVRVEGAEGDCDLGSVSGDVYASRVKGSVEAEVVSGSVRLLEISEAQRVSAKSISGSVEYRGQVYSDGRYQFKSHSGSVTLVLPADSSFELEAEAFSGSVSTEFPIEIIGKISNKEIKGKVNKGGAYIIAKAFSGNVEIRKGS